MKICCWGLFWWRIDFIVIWCQLLLLFYFVYRLFLQLTTFFYGLWLFTQIELNVTTKCILYCFYLSVNWTLDINFYIKTEFEYLDEREIHLCEKLFIGVIRLLLFVWGVFFLWKLNVWKVWNKRVYSGSLFVGKIIEFCVFGEISNLWNNGSWSEFYK